MQMWILNNIMRIIRWYVEQLDMSFMYADKCCLCSCWYLRQIFRIGDSLVMLFSPDKVTTQRRCGGWLFFLLDFLAKYEETSAEWLSANPAVAVPLLTISGWIVMQTKVTGGSVSFYANWAAYRDGFGSATDNDNYWLGLDKIYRLLQLGNLRFRVEVIIYTVDCNPDRDPGRDIIPPILKFLDWQTCLELPNWLQKLS